MVIPTDISQSAYLERRPTERLSKWAISAARETALAFSRMACDDGLLAQVRQAVAGGAGAPGIIEGDVPR